MDRLKRPRADRDQDCAPLLADLSPMQLEEFDGNEWVETPVQPLDNLTVETMWKHVIDAKNKTNAFNTKRASGTFVAEGFRLIVQSRETVHLVDLKTRQIFHLVHCKTQEDDRETDIWFFIEALKYSMHPRGHRKVSTRLYHRDALGCTLTISFMREPEDVKTFVVAGRLIA